MGIRLLRCCGTVILAVALSASPAGAQRPDAEAMPEWGASLGLVTVPEHALYQGRLYLQSGGTLHGAGYVERAHNVVGVRAGLHFRTPSGTKLAIGVYGTRGTSTGQYTGIAGPESSTRDLDVAGVDAGWEPAVVETGRWTVQVPIGPALAWQRLQLSAGHRNAYARPDGGTVEGVEWSDRTWTSIGGHLGMTVNLRAASHLNLYVAGRGRLLLNRGTGSWGDHEGADIYRSTGNTVTITYTDRAVLQSAVEAGLEWQP